MINVQFEIKEYANYITRQLITIAYRISVLLALYTLFKASNSYIAISLLFS